MSTTETPPSTALHPLYPTTICTPHSRFTHLEPQLAANPTSPSPSPTATAYPNLLPRRPHLKPPFPTDRRPPPQPLTQQLQSTRASRIDRTYRSRPCARRRRRPPTDLFHSIRPRPLQARRPPCPVIATTISWYAALHARSRTLSPACSALPALLLSFPYLYVAYYVLRCSLHASNPPPSRTAFMSPEINQMTTES